MKILVINGPNLNMLGKRPKEHYGSKTLDEINQMIKESAPMYEFMFFQSNHEGAIVDRIQVLDYDAIIINPAAYTHTSVAIRDALEIVDKPKVEVHLSDVFNRDDFRKIDYIKDVCDTCITNLKEQSYIKALEYLQKIL
jgi:3-dehydroquinate dehydratase-2